jgi:hypothetical protein
MHNKFLPAFIIVFIASTIASYMIMMEISAQRHAEELAKMPYIDKSVGMKGDDIPVKPVVKKEPDPSEDGIIDYDPDSKGEFILAKRGNTTYKFVWNYYKGVEEYDFTNELFNFNNDILVDYVILKNGTETRYPTDLKLLSGRGTSSFYIIKDLNQIGKIILYQTLPGTDGHFEYVVDLESGEITSLVDIENAADGANCSNLPINDNRQGLYLFVCEVGDIWKLYSYNLETKKYSTVVELSKEESFMCKLEYDGYLVTNTTGSVINIDVCENGENNWDGDYDVHRTISVDVKTL